MKNMLVGCWTFLTINYEKHACSLLQLEQNWWAKILDVPGPYLAKHAYCLFRLQQNWWAKILDVLGPYLEALDALFPIHCLLFIV